MYIINRKMKRREDSYTKRIGGNLKKRSGKSEKNGNFVSGKCGMRQKMRLKRSGKSEKKKIKWEAENFEVVSGGFL